MSAAHPLAPLLARAHMTQAELARQLRLDASTVHLWISGKRPVPQSRIAALAEVLQVTAEEIAEPPPPVLDEIAPASAHSRASAWLQAEAALEARAAEFRAHVGQVRYMPAVEAIIMGPSVRRRERVLR